jgi:hypothetical protein
LDALTPGVAASIDARFTSPNQIEIATENLEGFTLRLEGHPKYSPRRPLKIIVDGVGQAPRPAAGAPAGLLSFSRLSGKWQPGEATARGKRAGAEGPVADALGTRHIYVFGTSGAGQEQIRERREQAARGAEWSTPQLRLLLSHRVAADRELKDADLKSANLVLFGSKETNSLIEKFADRLPLQLNPGAADYGLIFVAPVDGKYVVVNSGLPWWTGIEQAQRSGLRFIRSPYAALMTFGDYILFKGSLANVVAEGRFDNDWKLPQAEREKIEASGAVTVR